MNLLSEYEQGQIKEIKAWKEERPGVVTVAMGKVLAPLLWLVQKIIPAKAIQGVLSGANAVAQWAADEGDIIRDGKVSSIGDLRKADIKVCDELANSVHNWAIGLATGEGAGTGAGGVFLLAADIPLIITIALRTIHKIGLCYGYRLTGQNEQQFIFGILAASGANTMEEKIAALLNLKSFEQMIANQTWRAIGEKAIEAELSKEGVVVAARALAKQLGVNLTRRKMLQAIPVIGAAVGASVNGWYIKEVGWAARRAFQERWLIENDKVIDI